MEVILVHGLWYGKSTMSFLARHLRRNGFGASLFSYRATGSPLASHALRLAQFAEESYGSGAQLNFVGHSLGGLVILHMLAAWRGHLTGRAVLLGTPLHGSQVARNMTRIPGGKILLGQVAADLCSGRRLRRSGCEVGMIAGCRPIGLGRLLGQSGISSDGTVALEEADAPWLAGRVVLPVSHTGMLFSTPVADEVVSFLRDGRFTAHSVARDN